MRLKIRRQRNFWYLVVFIVALFICLILFNWIRVFGFVGEGRQSINLEEAQSLVVFPICVPEQLPNSVNSDVEIRYYLDSGTPLSNANIHLNYKNKKSHGLEIEILETHTESSLSSEDFDVTFRSEQVKVIILYKLGNQFKLIAMPDDQLDTEVKQLQIQTVVHKSSTTWLSHEIIKPEKYRSTMTEWISNNVHYQIFSFLPTDDLNNFTLSMIEQCY